jgi:E3 ubiquitin-protein ligase EL5
MTQGSDEGAGAAHPSWPSGADADTPVAPTAGAAAAMTLGSILTVAGIFLLFVIFAFALASLQYCFESRRDRDRDARTGRRGGGSRGGGVDPELLRSLPVTVYRAPPQGSYKGRQQGVVLECAVCLAELQDGEEARFLPRCGHGFHAECVDMWLASHTTCPLCRTTVTKPDASPPTPSLALPPVPPEPANYYATASLPATSVLLGVSSGHSAVTMTTDVPPNPSTGSTASMVIEIPDLAAPTPTLTPRDAARSPGSARLRSIRRLWSFGRQGAGATSSCSCAGAGASEGVDLEQGLS